MMDQELKRWFRDEMCDEMYREILHFLSSVEIREGKFEGNEILINKLNRDTAILYLEYEMSDGTYEYSQNAKIMHIPTLIYELKKWKEDEF